MSTTPNMNLTLPVVSQTTGPLWASQINSDLSVIDSHNHAPGAGALIPSAALNINADVGFGAYNAVGLTSTQYVNQIQPTAACAVYAFNGDLYYNDASAVSVQITSGGSVVGSPGNWTGLAPPAEAAFNVGTGTFSFKTNATTFGWLQAASLALQATTTSNPIGVIASPSTAAYNLTLPTVAAPQVGSLLSSSNTGTMSWVTGNSTMTVTSSTIGISNGGVGTTQLADASVTQAKMALKSASYVARTTTLNVSGPASTIVMQLSSQNFVAGRPVYVSVTGLKQDVTVPDPVYCVASGSVQMYLLVTSPASVTTHFSNVFLIPSVNTLPSISGLYDVQTAGLHTIALICYIASGGSSLQIDNVALEAFQL